MPKGNPIVALGDIDYMVYTTGFAAEHNFYLATAGEGDDAYIPFGECDNKADATKHLAELEGHTNPQLWQRTEVEPVENALHSVKIGLNSIEERIEKKYGRPVDMQLFLTGTGNFREKIATIRPYKGNRDPRHKPALMREIRRYLIEVWGAQVIHDREADDEVCMRQTDIGNNADSVIFGIDKDLHQCPGLHYSTNKDAFANITRKQGDLLLYRQMITGDSVDNIMGCYRLGASYARGLITADMDNKAKWAAVLLAFEKNMEKHPDQYPDGMTPEEAANETASLVYMLRGLGDRWTAPK